ncbi:MAG: transporter substrate-binding domain-containing protein [Desulfuromonadales bacterium]|nr:transporter substrate-binding domain-containing protein [Desulfuromonadales bacterium]
MNTIKLSQIAAYIFRTVTLITLLLVSSSCFAAIPENIHSLTSIRVVMDDNYPPYVFENDQGQLQGIIVDQWRLWEKKTGIRVEITGTDWGEAQRRMQTGEFDVIDTIFRNEKREKIYDFTKPYADIPVPLFFHSDISGISGPDDAKGFLVAAKAGGNVIDVLRKHGVTNIVEYSSYEKIIEAARDGKVKVFTVDRPPALYFLNKMGIQNRFRETEPLYHGEFHRAVLKGHTALLEVVENGFAAIPKADYETINKRWMGASLASTPYVRYALYCAGVVAVLALVLAIWLWILKRAVTNRTQELAMSEEHHRLILQTAMSGICLADMQGRLLEVNKSYCRMSGYSEQELLTMSISDLEVNDSEDDITNRIRMVHEQGEARFESRHRRKDGTVFDVEVSVQCLPTNNGQCVAFFQDITERKHYEKNLLDKNSELERFTYTVSHDLKSPLITINTFAGMIQQDLKKGDHANISEDLGRISDASTKMGLLLDDLLKLSRIGRMINEPSRIDMNALVHDTLALLDGTISQRQVEIVVQPDLPGIFGDQQRIGMVLQNLLENAFKYMGNQAAPHIEIGAFCKSNETIFFVSDNGIGIDPRQHENIFGLFKKLDAKSQGTGIGLALVERIIDVHGGSIRVESEGPGTGSRFLFTVPERRDTFTEPVKTGRDDLVRDGG